MALPISCDEAVIPVPTYSSRINATLPMPLYALR